LVVIVVVVVVVIVVVVAVLVSMCREAIQVMSEWP
jgi:hypothetical protein